MTEKSRTEDNMKYEITERNIQDRSWFFGRTNKLSDLNGMEQFLIIQYDTEYDFEFTILFTLGTVVKYGLICPESYFMIYL